MLLSACHLQQPAELTRSRASPRLLQPGTCNMQFSQSHPFIAQLTYVKRYLQADGTPPGSAPTSPQAAGWLWRCHQAAEDRSLLASRHLSPGPRSPAAAAERPGAAATADGTLWSCLHIAPGAWMLQSSIQLPRDAQVLGSVYHPPSARHLESCSPSLVDAVVLSTACALACS